MALMDFIKQQFIEVIHWTESEEGVLAYRFPMQDMEIQYGEQLTPLHTACVVAGATMPMRYTTSAALHHLARWVAPRNADGTIIAVGHPGAHVEDEAEPHHHPHHPQHKGSTE